MKERIQGAVLLEGVVGTDGRIGNIRVVRSLDSVYGLDYEAITCAGLWRFRPGMRAGMAVPVLVTISISFALSDGPSRH